MKALVLGATGFVGGNLARELLARGFEVRAFRRTRGPAPALEGLQVEEAYGDLRNRASVEAALEGCDVLFHAAGYYPTNALDVLGAVREGIAGMRSVLDAARWAGVSRVVYTSSLSTIGRPSGPNRLADERDHYLPGRRGYAYAEAKYAMEQEVRRYVLEGLPAVIVCPTAAFGPGDVKPTSGTALLMIARGAAPAYVGGRMNVVDVRDVAAAQVAAAEKGKIGERYIIGGWNVTIGDLVRTMAEAAGVPPPTARVPLGMARAAATVAENVGRLIPGNPVRYLSTGVQQIQLGQFFDTSKAERELGLTRRPLIETFVDSLAWFRSYGYLS